MSTFSNPKIGRSTTMNASSKPIEIDQEHEDLLTLSLSTRNSPPISPHSTPLSPTPLSLFQQVPQPPPPPPPYDFHLAHLPHNNSPPGEAPGPARPARARRSPVQTLKQGKTETIPPPFPWATNKRATVHSLDHLLSAGIKTVTGVVQCKKCDQSYEVEYDLREKFMELARFVTEHKCGMHDRAPAVWMNPTLPNCKLCDQNNCMKPVMSKKRSINWLFLLLGQMLGCCKLSELKYFCKHTKNHRTGAKDRVLYLTYLGLCKQLDPSGPFEV